VTWYGHAAVLFESAGRRILVGPLFHRCSVPARRGVVLPPDPRDVGPVDAVLITHADNDHLNPESLAWLPRTTPVFVPAAVAPEPYHVDMRAQLGALGFANVTALAEWERVQLGDVSIVAAPFAGEDWGLRLPARTYLLHGPGLTVYLSADAAAMPEVHRRLGAEFTVDLACLGVSGCAEAHAMPPGYGYGHFYLPWIPEERHAEWVALCSGPDESADAAELLGARHAFGYASGGASFMAVAYTDRGTHADLSAALRARGSRVAPLDLPLGTLVRLPP
jgi:L-ascorbate metabolism protein UlaG (beta-lactamase superfamily)